VARSTTNLHAFLRRITPIAIAAITVAVFAPALWYGFVQWDDDRNLLTNLHYRGLGWAQLRWAFTSAVMGHWIPMTWLTFGLDHALWGMDAFGYHLSNIVLHAANAVLFYLLALRLLARSLATAGKGPLTLGAAAAALFFAVHPLRVESVAWVSERKDVLSTLFGLLAINTYLAPYRMSVVDDVNGKKIRTLEDLSKVLSEPADRFVINMVGDGPPLVLDPKQVEDARDRIKKRYNVVQEENLTEQPSKQPDPAKKL